MLQDLMFGRLENEYRVHHPWQDDWVVCVRDDQVLVHALACGDSVLPRADQVRRWAAHSRWQSWGGEKLRYALRSQMQEYYLFYGEAGDCPDAAFEYVPVRTLMRREAKDLAFPLVTAWHIFNWYRSNRFCGRCGQLTRHDDRQRLLRCDSCGNMIFPRIAPVVIVAVTNGEKLLLSKYAGRAYTNYSLIAGYVEVGETLEQGLRREVLEEVGLRVKNIRYYKSQPWGIDGNLLMGFFCDLDGDDTILLDEEELALAQWHSREALPQSDDDISLTWEMIRLFGQGKEPR